jgi:Tfp pilus assembly protein PilV
MDGTSLTTGRRRRRDEQGVTLIETMMAVAILLTVAGGLLSLFTISIEMNEQMGNTSTRTTEYAQDKMEQLMSRDFNDANLGGTMAASSSVGSVPPAAVVSGYVDYFDQSGNALATSTGEFYTRQWSIATDSAGTLKSITVVVTAEPLRKHGIVPSTKLGCVKSSGF